MEEPCSLILPNNSISVFPNQKFIFINLELKFNIILAFKNLVKAVFFMFKKFFILCIYFYS